MKHLLQSSCTLGAGLLFLAGCQVGPNYKTPRAEVSESFDTGPELLPTTLPAITPTSLAAANQPTTPSSDALAAATRASTQPSAGPVDLTHWWTALDDAELNSLVSRTVASNLDIAIAAERIQEIRETFGAVSDEALPVLGASGAIARAGSNSTKGRVSAPLNAGTNTAGLKEITQVAGFDAGWELDLFGRLARQEEAAQADVESSVEARNQVLVSVIADVARSYINLRSAQLRLHITNDNIAALSANGRADARLAQTRHRHRTRRRAL